jgi:hypothetical protein
VKELTLEVGRAPRSTSCKKCGRSVVSTAGFVYADGDAYAVYMAALHRHGPKPAADLAVGMGTWAREDAVADASAFLHVSADERETTFGFVDPSESSWSGARVLRNQLSAAAARDSHERPELLRVAELVVAEDNAVARHLHLPKSPNAH